ncbi:MAG: class II aldolase/adducin family protein [Sandaracinaceae bacterium]|nr:MAG: class II aldolase/adducin family protein [Sandaracinaceae bacterium]HBQ11819.1 class II aldolase [Myxococcales bacterium]
MSTPEERAIRVDLAAAYRLVAHYGWDDLIFTHLSARAPGPEHHFFINPYGMLFEEITASSLVKVDLAGDKVEDSPWPVNPAGFTIHSAVHEAREDAACVMHLHTVDGVAVSVMDCGLLPQTQTAMVVHADLAYHEYEGIALDHAERPRLAQDLGDKGCMMLWNHGTLTLGRSVAEAFFRMYALERACSTQVRFMAGPGIHEAPEGIAAKVAAQVAVPEFGRVVIDELAWPALKRMLDRRDPSYKD